jgi:phenylalanine-4-hydroxylase
MFEEAQLYSPVQQAADGSVEVQLAADHPGAVDPGYRRRRNEIAALALAWSPGEPIPHAAYTDVEHDIWRIVCQELRPKHEQYAIREFLDARDRLGLPEDRVPQLDEVGAGLQRCTGWSYVPAAGLVPLREFYESLADRRFHSTQYLRHHSVPLYTPEPDVVHEVIGHGNTLASQRFADLYVEAGRAARRVQSEEALEFVSHVFWFTLEFGVMWEAGELRCYGAGLLSSFGEIEQFRTADVRPLDVAAMGLQGYDITHYQPILFAAESMDHLEEVVGGFFAEADDDRCAALARGAAGAATA